MTTAQQRILAGAAEWMNRALSAEAEVEALRRNKSQVSNVLAGVLIEREALRGKIAAALRNHRHDYFCDLAMSTATPDYTQKCNCWRAALDGAE